MKRQAAAHSDHLTDVLRVQEAHLLESYKVLLEENLVAAKDDMRQEIAQSITRLKGIEKAIEGNYYEILYLIKDLSPFVWHERVRRLATVLTDVN